jgi:hypothetical protein
MGIMCECKRCSTCNRLNQTQDRHSSIYLSCVASSFGGAANREGTFTPENTSQGYAEAGLPIAVNLWGRLPYSYKLTDEERRKKDESSA